MNRIFGILFIMIFTISLCGCQSVQYTKSKTPESITLADYCIKYGVDFCVMGNVITQNYSNSDSEITFNIDKNLYGHAGKSTVHISLINYGRSRDRLASGWPLETLSAQEILNSNKVILFLDTEIESNLTIVVAMSLGEFERSFM
jgi:hypothetical protein